MASKNFILLCFLLSCITVQAQFPDLTTAKMSLGGSVAFESKLEIEHAYYLDIKINPSISYIINNDWEVGARPVLNIALLRPFKANIAEWGAGGFFRKHFVLHERYTLYTGSSLSVRFFDANWKSFRSVLGAEVGVLIGLNEHVAIDIGLPGAVYLDAMTAFNRVELPMGFFGLKAFF